MFFKEIKHVKKPDSSAVNVWESDSSGAWASSGLARPLRGFEGLSWAVPAISLSDVLGVAVEEPAEVSYS